MQRLVSLLALLSTLGFMTPASMRFHHTMVDKPRFVREETVPCASTGQAASSASIISPQSDSVISGMVPLAISPGEDTMTGADVCASYRDSNGITWHDQRIATLTAAQGWASSWDVSTYPGQDYVSLSFIEEPSGQLIGTVSGLSIAHIADNTPPSSTAAILATTLYAKGTSTYISATTPISMAATDPPLPSGLPDTVTVYYQIDGSPAITYSAPFALGLIGDGSHIITYWAVDGSGNVETPHTLDVTLDTTPPVVNEIDTGNIDSTGVASGPVTVTLNGDDTGSGVDQIYYSNGTEAEQLYSQPIVLSTSSDIAYYAIDRAGNISTPRTHTISITAPAPTATPYPVSSVTPVPTRTPRPANTPRPSPTTRPTETPRPTDTPRPSATARPATTTLRPPTAVPTPRPTPTWAPIDGPPILPRQPLTAPAPGNGPGRAAPLHLHAFPPLAPDRLAPHPPARRHAPPPVRAFTVPLTVPLTVPRQGDRTTGQRPAYSYRFTPLYWPHNNVDQPAGRARPTPSWRPWRLLLLYRPDSRYSK